VFVYTILAGSFINTMLGQFCKQKMHLVAGSLQQEGCATVNSLTLVVSLLPPIILLLQLLSQLKQLLRKEHISLMAICVCVNLNMEWTSVQIFQ